jgi:hypothetical protein
LVFGSLDVEIEQVHAAGVLLVSGKLATELDRLNLIDEYKFLAHPRIAGHGPLPKGATKHAVHGGVVSRWSR